MVPEIINVMKKTARGFTLIELLVVISIIAILSVIGMVVFTGVQKNARDAVKKADLNAMSKAMEVVYSSEGAYRALQPTDFASGSVPKTPEGEDYAQVTTADGSGYRLCASQGGGSCITSSPTCTCVGSAIPPGTTLQGPVMEDFGTESLPAASCKDILTTKGGSNGIYTIQPAGVSNAFDVYCDMTTDGGGWTLLMKSDGNTSTFQYSANYWTSANTLNTNSPGILPGEAKYNSFNYLPITEIKATFPTLNLFMKETVVQTTALSLFQNTNSLATRAAAWQKFQDWGLNTSLPYQNGYKEYGFNLNCTSSARVRWGWMWNNEAICSSNDVSSGIGMTSRFSTTMGGWSTCCAVSIPAGNSYYLPPDDYGYAKRVMIWGR